MCGKKTKSRAERAEGKYFGRFVAVAARVYVCVRVSLHLFTNPGDGWCCYRVCPKCIRCLRVRGCACAPTYELVHVRLMMMRLAELIFFSPLFDPLSMIEPRKSLKMEFTISLNGKYFLNVPFFPSLPQWIDGRASTQKVTRTESETQKNVMGV